MWGEIIKLILQNHKTYVKLKPINRITKMYELRQKAKDNRANGTIPSYPPTQAETDALDSPLLNIE